MHEPKWCLFFDFHTMPACPDVGAGFDADAFTDRIKACGVDYIVFPARCNLGMAYYDTKVGIRHYSLKFDMLGKLVEACRARDIAISAYINVGLSHEEALLHRDWTILSPEGITYGSNRATNSFFRRMCYNTAYGEHVLEMVREVISGYGVSGLFLDCMHDRPCVGVECIREMKERGIDWTDSKQLADFGNSSRIRMARRIAEAAGAIRPDLLLYFNGVSFEEQQEVGTYLEIECLPAGGWGYEFLPLYSRYARNLDKPLLNQIGRFHRSWGDFGGIRTEAGLEYDCLYGLANGLRTDVGGHLHPRGDINHAVFDLIEPVYARLQKLEPWLEKAKPLTEAAVIVPQPGFGNVELESSEQGINAAKGATRMLCELKAQFDVLTDISPWEGYSLLILPDFVLLDEAAAGRIRKHLNGGGAILASGWSGLDLDPDKNGFVFKEWGLKFQGDDPYDPAYFIAGPKLNKNMPAMPLNFYERGTSIAPDEGTEVLAEIIAPYYNQHWDGEHGFRYTPPDRPAGRPAATLRDSVAYISHPVFISYYNHAPVPLRQLVANLMTKLLPAPMIKAPGLPSFARVTVTSQAKRRMVHVLAYVPERRGPTMDMIEEPIEVRDVLLSLRLDERPPERVYLAPARQDLPFEIADGYVRATIPVVRGYALVVFEEQE